MSSSPAPTHNTPIFPTMGYWDIEDGGGPINTKCPGTPVFSFASSRTKLMILQSQQFVVTLQSQQIEKKLVLLCFI